MRALIAPERLPGKPYRLLGLWLALILLSGCGEREPAELSCDQPAVVDAVLNEARAELRVVLLQLAWLEADLPLPEAIIALDPQDPDQQKRVLSIAREQGATDAIIEQTRHWLDQLHLTDIFTEQQDDVIDLLRCRARLQGLPTGEQTIGYSVQRDLQTQDLEVRLIGL
ncbi:MAG TPA: hypothetical protein ENM98_03705 [Halothiobacillaceae bacterium]|nr:hypothetical protein [Halothiobacillaceae bacterium]